MLSANAFNSPQCAPQLAIMKPSKGSYLRLAIDVLLAVVAIGCLVALFIANKSSDESEFGLLTVQPKLRHLVILSRPGERYPIIPLAPFEYELGVQTVAGQRQMRELGRRLHDDYDEFAKSASEVFWTTTNDARNIEASETLLTELGLNATSFRLLPPVLNSGLDELYMRLTPILDYLRSAIPDCVRQLAEQEVGTTLLKTFKLFKKKLFIFSG